MFSENESDQQPAVAKFDPSGRRYSIEMAGSPEKKKPNAEISAIDNDVSSVEKEKNGDSIDGTTNTIAMVVTSSSGFQDLEDVGSDEGDVGDLQVEEDEDAMDADDDDDDGDGGDGVLTSSSSSLSTNHPAANTDITNTSTFIISNNNGSADQANLLLDEDEDNRQLTLSSLSSATPAPPPPPPLTLTLQEYLSEPIEINPKLDVRNSLSALHLLTRSKSPTSSMNPGAPEAVVEGEEEEEEVLIMTPGQKALPDNAAFDLLSSEGVVSANTSSHLSSPVTVNPVSDDHGYSDDDDFDEQGEEEEVVTEIKKSSEIGKKKKKHNI